MTFGLKRALIGGQITTMELEMKKSDPNRVEERLTEVQRSRNFQKGGEGRLGEDRRRDGTARRRRTRLEMKSWHRKVGHAPICVGAWNSGPVDRPCAPWNLRSPDREELVEKSHWWRGDPTEAAAMEEGSGRRIK